MKRLFLTLLICGFALGAADILAQAQTQTPSVMVGKWNQSAKLAAGTLTYYWITPKPNQKFMMVQSLAGYDQHTINIVLTPPQLAWVRQWEKRHRVFGLPRRYPKPHGVQTYAAAFGTSLNVKDAGKSISSVWNQTDKAPRADVAVAAFLTWARQTTRGK